MADGKVVISTALDNSGLERGVKSVKGTLGGLGKVAATTAAAITAAFAAAAVSITKQAVDAYADYEQMIGGVETMFKDSADKIVEYAEDAFYTVGISANEYMSMVTGFSASLIKSLAGDTAKAADIANMALVDMADNANKLGTPMESIQNAYQGFAKQNYTMLDNLKLGYGGTKSEMERLLKDAQKLTGVKYDIDNLADVYSAIHAIQVEMGIAGTTAKEAEKTISGSAAMAKAAWKDVLSAIAGGGDLDKAIDNFVDSFETYMDNLVPVIKRALVGIGEVAEEVIPELVKELASAIVQALPSLVSAVWKSLVGVVEGVIDGFVALITGGTVKIINGQTDAIDQSVGSQNALTDAVEDTNKELDKTLASFDEITKIGGETEKASGEISIEVSGGELEKVEKESSLIADAWESIVDWSKEFFFEVIGNMSIKNIQNLGAAMTNLKSGWMNFVAAFFGGEGSDWSAAEWMAGIADTNVLVTAGLMKALGGALDLAAENRRHTDETGDFNPLDTVLGDEDGWDALGEIISAIGMISTAFQSGDTREAMEDLFLPITEEYTNMFKGLSTSAAEALAAINKEYSNFNRDLRELGWSDAVISEGDVAAVEARLSALLAGTDAINQKALEEAKASVHELLAQGLIDEEQAKESIQKLEDAYAAQKKQIEDNNAKILEILRKAREKKRSLTTEESAKIQELMRSSWDKTTAIITQGASDSEDVYEALEENRGKMTKQMLSETILYANEEYATKVQAAKDEYDAAIASAERLYNDLGMIDEAEYQRIKEDAEKKRDVQIEEAKTAREKLVAEAQEAAGDVASAVDAETGEILSKWEQMWNDAYETVSQVWQAIKNFLKEALNGVGDYLNTPVKTLNSWSSILGGTTVLGVTMPSFSLPEIPKLAQGAVLPANKPFLAMVSDQKHGTNVEAPLSTIQEAVAIVMEDMVASNVAGQEAILEVLKDILEAVLGIEIGDDVLGQAVERYNRKMAVIRGGKA